jgi:hypothetical protein
MITSTSPDRSDRSSGLGAEGSGVGVGVEVGVGVGSGVGDSSITIVSRTGESSAADAVSDPTTYAPSGTTSASPASTFHVVLMVRTILPDGGASVRDR